MIPEEQKVNGKMYRTNKVGGADVFTVEPRIKCPECGGEAVCDDWIDNGFGPYSVQAGPYRCNQCHWIERSPYEDI